jgi:hypothetical protein
MACALLRTTYMKILILSFVAALAACATTGRYEYGVAVSSPDLVYVEPGVSVVADADAPLFYSDGYYWLYRDGYWARSPSYHGGFARVDVNLVPQRVRYISHPEGYAHYRRHHEGRIYAQPTIRDHRHY